MYGVIIGKCFWGVKEVKGDTRSLDYSTYNAILSEVVDPAKNRGV